MKLKRFTNPDFIDIYEVYSDKMFIGANCIAIPYINIGLMPKNPISGTQSVIDYSYCVFKGVDSMVFNATKGNLSIDFNIILRERNTEYISFGGYKSENGAEVEISYEQFLFYLPDSARIEQPPFLFIPMDTPYYKQNMNKEEVGVFFSLQNLPHEIKEILGHNIFSLRLW